jgi:hypothetical protein
MAFIHILSKFAEEAMALELFFIGLLGLSLFGFYLFRRRRYGVAGKQIPDHVVKAFLFEILSLSEGFKRQLFGQAPLEGGPGITAEAMVAARAAAGAFAGPAAAQAGGNDAALQAQLAGLATKNDELTKLVQALTADKKSLEDKLKAAAAAGTAPPAGDDSELKAKITNLEARLAEYEVIEDDLANLKRYQQENKQLKATIDMMKRGGTAVPAAAAVAAAPAPAPTPIAQAEQAVGDAQAEAALAATAEEIIAPPATDGVADAAAITAAQTAPASSDTGPIPTPAPAPVVAKKDEAKEAPKSDSDLLSEFEKMLSG